MRIRMKKLNNMIRIISLFLSTLLVSCKQPKKVINKDKVENQVAIDTSWKNEQRKLHYWLMTQPQEVRDSFKREFTFSRQEIDRLIDTLRNH